MEKYVILLFLSISRLGAAENNSSEQDIVSKKFGLQGLVEAIRPQHFMTEDATTVKKYTHDCKPWQEDTEDGCICVEGYTGPMCEELRCNGKGRYIKGLDECQCYTGYGGRQCTHCVDGFIRARDPYGGEISCISPPPRQIEGYYGRGMGLLGFATVFLMIAAYSTWRRRLMTRNARTLLLETVIQRETQQQTNQRRPTRGGRSTGFASRRTLPVDLHFTGVFVPSSCSNGTTHSRSTQYEAPPAYFEYGSTSEGDEAASVPPGYSEVTRPEPPPTYSEAVLEIARRQQARSGDSIDNSEESPPEPPPSSAAAHTQAHDVQHNTSGVSVTTSQNPPE